MTLYAVAPPVLDSMEDIRRHGAESATTINAAVTAAIAAAAGKAVFIPAGDWAIDTLTINSPATIVLDDAATLTLRDGNNGTAIIITDTERVTIRGGEIDANGAGQTSGVNRGIAVVRSPDVHLDRVAVRNSNSYGIYAGNSDRVRLTKNEVYDSLSTGIFVEASSTATANIYDADISDNMVDRSSLDPATITTGGIQVHGYATGGKYALGAKVRGNTVHMPVNPTSSGAICIECFGLAYHSTVNGNVTYGGSMGVSIDRGNFTAVGANTIAYPSSYGIELASSQFCTVAGNAIEGDGVTPTAIICSNSSGGYNTIGLNAINGTTGSAIKVTNSPFSTVSANSIKATAAYAVELIASDDCTITGNALDGQSSATKAVMLNTSSGIAVTGNRMKNFTQHGVLIYGASAVTLDRIAVTGNVFENVTSFVNTSLSGGATIGSHVRAQGNAGMTQNGKACDILDFNTFVRELWGTGSPEGVVGSGIGSLYHRTDGGASTTLYVKESGTSTSNTGWVAK